MGFRELPDWWTHGDLGRVAVGRELGCSLTFPLTLPYISLPSNSSYITSFCNKPAIKYVKGVSESVSHSSKLTKSKKWVLVLPIYILSFKSTSINLNLDWSLKYMCSGGSCRPKHVICAVRCYLQATIVRVELNCKTPRWHLRIAYCWVCRKYPPHSHWIRCRTFHCKLENG